jgi:beta-glucuronidase
LALADFRSPRRILPSVQDGWNPKGPIGENGDVLRPMHRSA